MSWIFILRDATLQWSRGCLGRKQPIAFLRAFETGGPESETLTTSRLHPTTKEPLKILLITILPRFSNPI